MTKRAIAIVSGGMDSVTLAYLLKSEGYDLHLVSFNYGQRHEKELLYAAKAAKALDASHDVISLAGIGKHLTGSALTDTLAVPEGHYAAPSMRLTVVPNRNAILLACAYGIAVAQGADVVALGVHAGDHPIYPDCRPAFIAAFDAMERLATESYGKEGLHLYAPFVNKTKQDIVTIGHTLGVPFQDTWSCYKGEDRHCGVCGTCQERAEAFTLAGVPDPTRYASA